MKKDRPNDIEHHINALMKHAVVLERQPRQIAETKVQSKQLRAIDNAIRQLERSGLPVPRGLKAESDTLKSNLRDRDSAPAMTAKTYENILEIVERLGRACGRTPHRDLYRRSRERSSATTPSEKMRLELIHVLLQLGGRGREREVLEAVGDNLRDLLTEADLDRSKGQYSRWQQQVRRQARQLIREGMLIEERGRVWVLSEH